ncbi:hypothetical protein [Altererythrobacter aquiaggeris]|uniref:hypothetical protein n=1 Tax=Aestuarierythrobacter aquiaggeris TaxID=1898396 RepID=UPI0030167FC2
MEQALVFTSIILGVAVAFELENLNRLLRSNEVRWHWAQPIFAAFVLMILMFFWWSLAKNPQGTISFGAFLPIMWSLVMLVLLSAVALPDKVEGGVDLAQYYQQNRRYMWGLLLLAAIPLQGQWFYKVAVSSTSIGEFVGRAMGDIVAWTMIIAMMFIRRWWQVAIGFAFLSLGPLAWLSRTI